MFWNGFVGEFSLCTSTNSDITAVYHLNQVYTMFFWHMLRAHKLLGRSPEEQERAASASAGQLNLKRVSRPVHAPCSSTAKATAYGSALGIVVLHGVVTLVQLLIHGHLGRRRASSAPPLGFAHHAPVSDLLQRSECYSDVTWNATSVSLGCNRMKPRFRSCPTRTHVNLGCSAVVAKHMKLGTRIHICKSLLLSGTAFAVSNCFYGTL